MVIHQFNKLIKNKWVWGVFAILVSIAFLAPDEWFRGRGDESASADARNRLSGVEYDSKLFDQCRVLSSEFLTRFGGPAAAFFSGKTDKDAWKTYAAVVAFRKAGCDTPDTLLAERVKMLFSNPDGSFREADYAQRIKDLFRMDTKPFESMLRLMMTLESGIAAVAGTSSWPSSMEADQAARDFTDKFTVQIATFDEDKAAADAVKLDDESLAKWFGENVSKLSLPDRYRFRYIEFDASDSNVTARVAVTEEQIKERYDANSEKGMYDVPPATTNDVKTVKPLEEVRGSIEIALKAEAALEICRNDVENETADDIYWNNAEAARDLLPNVASSTGKEIKTTGWISLRWYRLRELAGSVESAFPGVRRARPSDAFEAVAKGDRPFGIVTSADKVWLVDLEEKSAAHDPALDEVKPYVGDMALADLRASAFRDRVAAIAAKGADEVLASKTVSTNIVFSPCDYAPDVPSGWSNRYGEWDFSGAPFQNASGVVFAARKLSSGEVSEPVQVSQSRLLLVVCKDREAGDALSLVRGERFARRLDATAQTYGAVEGWIEANLKRLGWKEKTSSSEEAGPDED